MAAKRKPGPHGIGPAPPKQDGLLARFRQALPEPIGARDDVFDAYREAALQRLSAGYEPPLQKDRWLDVPLTRPAERGVRTRVTEQRVKIAFADEGDDGGWQLRVATPADWLDLARQLASHPVSAEVLGAMRGVSALPLDVWVAERLAEGVLKLLVRDVPAAPSAPSGPVNPPSPTPPRRRQPTPVEPPPAPVKKKAIRGRFTETTVKCGDPGHVEADGTNISESATTTFAIKGVRDGAAVPSVTASMKSQSVRGVDWKPKRPAGWKPGDEFVFTVSADGQSAESENKFKFFEYPDAGPTTKTFNCTSGVFGWTGKFDIAFAKDLVTVTVKIKLVNRLGEKPASGAAMPAAGDPVSDADKAAMKADVEGKLSNKVKLIRTSCRLRGGCSCHKPIKIVVSFVESGEHHVVNLFQGSGRANSGNWTRVKTRENSWAHETGHLLGWYDEYTGGAVGTAPRWKPNEPANVMNVGLTVPPEYAWDFRDWFKGASGEEWTAKK